MQSQKVITPEKIDRLERKYAKLLKLTTKLLYKRNKLTRQSNIINSSLLYLKTVYNQHYKRELKVSSLHSFYSVLMAIYLQNQRAVDLHELPKDQVVSFCDSNFDGRVEYLSSDDELVSKKVFLVEKDREYRAHKSFLKELKATNPKAYEQ